MSAVVGRCKRCGVEVGTIETPQNAWRGTRTTVLLANGSHLDLTICDKCAAVAREDESGFLGEIEEIVMKLWAEDGDKWVRQAFQFAVPFLAVSHIIPWKIAGRERGHGG